MGKLNEIATPDIAVGQLEVTTMYMRWVDNDGAWALEECKQGEGRQYAEFTVKPLNPEFNDYTRRFPVSGRKKSARDWFDVVLPSLKELKLDVDTDALSGLFVAAELVPQPGKEEFTTFKFTHSFGKGKAGLEAATKFAEGTFGAPTNGGGAEEKAPAADSLDADVVAYLKGKWQEIAADNKHLPAGIAAKKTEASFIEALEEEGLKEETIGLPMAKVVAIAKG